ncbi:hypothetical protein [Polyangium sorediatum]|uniref:Tetratricopeptide repeat protein n=1 Tax=Polyangium sorediatum TaxID=889274 RepID=A0ABT6P3I3_9BACT|nr:hypothetical protein [Polyangium sorediatum]MDI1434912.1 hypothetical protein [Polyangium sorediatum]
MRARLALIMLVVCSASPARAQDSHTLSPEAIDEAAQESEFAALVAKGDRERAAGRLSEAATSYAAAMRVRRDPVVGGRLGMLMVRDRPAQAAELLHDALKRANTTGVERQAFFNAYEAVRARGAWVDVVISHAGARVTLDGDPRNRAGLSAFSMFVLTGEHELRAGLDGYIDDARMFRVVPRKDLRIELTLKPRPLFDDERELQLLTREKGAPSVETLSDLGHASASDTPTFTKQEDPFGYEDPKPAERPAEKRWSVGGGPVVVLGVASWMPAVGVVAGGSFRPNEYVSLGLEGRAAWLTTGVGGEPISAMTAGGIASVCGYYRWAFGCAIGHLGIITIEPSSDAFTNRATTFFKPGIGARLGARFVLGHSFAVLGGVEVVGLSSGVRVGVGERIIAETPPLLTGSSIMGSWEF